MGPAKAWEREAEEIFGGKAVTGATPSKKNRLPAPYLKILQVMYDNTFPLNQYPESPKDKNAKNDLYAAMLEEVKGWDDAVKKSFSLHRWWTGRIRNHNGNPFIDNVVFVAKILILSCAPIFRSFRILGRETECKDSKVRQELECDHSDLDCGFGDSHCSEAGDSQAERYLSFLLSCFGLWKTSNIE